MTDREAMKMALEALEDSMYPQKKQFDAIVGLKQALAQPEQEPMEKLMTDREAMKMALELLCDAVEPTATQIQADIGMCAQWDVDAIECIDDLRQALAQPEQEPVAYLYHDTACAELANPLADSTLLVLACDRKPNGRNETPLYAAPPSKPWVGLTDDEIAMYDKRLSGSGVARDIETKLKEKNGG